MKSARFLSLLAVGAALATGASAATIYQVTSTRPVKTSGDPDYDGSYVIIGTAVNVSGTDADGIAPVAINRFNNNDQSNYLTMQSSGSTFSVSSQDNLDKEYINFTITADTGYALRLTDLVMDVRRATGSTGTTDRGLEIWATVDGGAFTYTEGGYLYQNLAIPSHRDSSEPDNISVSLADAAYQDIQSVTFRILNPGAGGYHGIEFNNFQVNGSVVPVPEPSFALLGLLGLVPLLRRRRDA